MPMSNPKIICVGAALIDDIFICREQPITGTSNPATFSRTAGGVAHNVAHHLALLSYDVKLISHLGKDSDGVWLSRECTHAGIDLTYSKLNDTPTGRFTAILTPEGELFSGASAMHFEREIDVPFLSALQHVLSEASLLILDCNLSLESLNWLLDFSRANKIPCIIEPVSVPKARKLFSAHVQDVLMVTPNYEEMFSINGRHDTNNIGTAIKVLLHRGVKNIWFRNGKNGSRMFTEKEVINLPAPKVEMLDSTGAGDAALAGWIHGWLNQKDMTECMRYGHSLASLVLKSSGAIAKNITTSMLENSVEN